MRVSPLIYLVILSVGLGSSALGRTDPDVAAFQAELARQCPEKHLEWLNPGWLADPVGEFLDRASPRQKAMYARSYKQYCAHVVAGASCGNFAAIKAAARSHLTRSQASDVCREPVVCTADLDCHAIRP